VLLRPAQVTLGRLVLVCKGAAQRFGAIGSEASAELAAVADGIERALADAFDHDRINYLMLMMVDPDVHFHVLPRYEAEREFAGQRFEDPFWPGPPDVTHRVELADGVQPALLAELRRHFG